MQVAKLAFDAGIYENAVSEAYFSMYNTLTSLLFTCGIKCENHAAAAVLLQELFKLYELHELFSQFKKERIDSQYYVVEQHMKKIHKEACSHLLSTAQRFNLLLRAYSRKLSKQEIAKIQNDFEVLLN